MLEISKGVIRGEHGGYSSSLHSINISNILMFNDILNWGRNEC